MLRQHCTGFFLVQDYLEPLGQHYRGFWPIQCCPKSIKKTLHRIFSYTKLSGASRTRKVFAKFCSTCTLKNICLLVQKFIILRDNCIWLFLSVKGLRTNVLFCLQYKCGTFILFWCNNQSSTGHLFNTVIFFSTVFILCKCNYKSLV